MRRAQEHAARDPAFVLLCFMLGSCCPPTILTDSLPPCRVEEPNFDALGVECWAETELQLGDGSLDFVF